MAISYICLLHTAGENEQEQPEPEHVTLTEYLHETPIPSPKSGF